MRRVLFENKVVNAYEVKDKGSVSETDRYLLEHSYLNRLIDVDGLVAYMYNNYFYGTFSNIKHTGTTIRVLHKGIEIFFTKYEIYNIGSIDLGNGDCIIKDDKCISRICPIHKNQ